MALDSLTLLDARAAGEDAAQSGPSPSADLARPALMFVLAHAYSAAFFVFGWTWLGWEMGVARGSMIALLIAGLILLRLTVRGSANPSAPMPRPVRLLLICALIVDLGIAMVTASLSLNTGMLALDQGQTTWRAARLLARGENPYGAGALVDNYAYKTRTIARAASGTISAIPAAQVDAALKQYDHTLDPTIRTALLPAPETNPPREDRILGYKYGPLIFAPVAAVAAFGEAAAVVVLNTLAWCLLAWSMSRLLRGIAPSPDGDATGWSALAAFGMAAVLLDFNIVWNSLFMTATDIYAMAFGALAVLAFRRNRPTGMAVALALAIGCKLFPSLMVAPLLLAIPGGWTARTRAMAVCAAVTGVIYAPFLIWDARGVIENVFLWPASMAGDSTSWLYFVPHSVGVASLVMCGGTIGFLWWRFTTGRERRLFWMLAITHALLLACAGTLHNNYIPWVSVWLVAAVAEALALRSSPQPSNARLAAA